MRRKLLYLQMVGVIVNGFSWTVVHSINISDFLYEGKTSEVRASQDASQISSIFHM